MKMKSLAVVISFALAGCGATQTTSNVASTNAATPAPVIQTVKAEEAAGALNSDEITLEQIMADPDWMGRSPESWYWGDDSRSIFYKQKREGSKIRDLYVTSIAGGNGKQVALSQLHEVSDNGAVKSPDGEHEVYTFEGDIFLKSLKDGTVKQVTRTSGAEYYPMFLNDGRIAYQTGNSFFAYDLKAGQVEELVNLVEGDEPKGTQDPDAYLAKENHKLIKYIAKQHKDAKDRELADKLLKNSNKAIVNNKFYFGNGNKIAQSSLSPNGDKVIVSVRKDGKRRNDTDIMPNYISSDGNIKAEKVRRRVADNIEYSETLFLVDLIQGTKTELSYKTLPGYNDDVLAEVRKENYAREGKKYENNRLPRNIALMAARSNIQWNAAGDQVALLLEAWDNKDRWIATVDLSLGQLVTQHRYHDPAWVNYSFNEFGWLNKKEALYFLSEESGYSQLYVKPIAGQVKALTTGNYVVDSLTVSNDENYVYYKANKKHPGIYEIYRVNIENGQSEALTDLGGMNDYSLSPDESRLLIEHSEVTMPPELYVKELSSNSATRITNTVSDKFLSLPWTAPSVVAVESSNTKAPIYSKVYLPKNFENSTQKHKAVMFSHGAGYLQNSHLGWSGYFREFMFHSMLAQKGYVVMDMDYRASKGYGRDWRTAIYRHMGKPEVEDMRDGVNWLVKNANVDRDRIGTYGGSYGGFLTLMSLFTAPDLFQSGAALRLVSDWAYYNHGYTSNILNTPKDDPIAYERSSPIYFADGLEKTLLINAPMVDNNVFFQDTVRLVQRLIELEKENFETAIFPVEPHGFTEPSSWLDEYRRIFKLFEKTL